MPLEAFTSSFAGNPEGMFVLLLVSIVGLVVIEVKNSIKKVKIK